MHNDRFQQLYWFLGKEHGVSQSAAWQALLPSIPGGPRDPVRVLGGSSGVEEKAHWARRVSESTRAPVERIKHLRY